MKRIALVLAALLLPLVAVACGGDDTKPAASPQAQATSAGQASTPSPPPTPAPPATAVPAQTAVAAVYDSRAVWDVSKAGDDIWKQVCGASPVMVREDDPCIVTVMQRAGAPQQAIDFYKQNGYFLRVLTERGRVDHGRGSAPWINMGRDTFQLFLNGTPPFEELSKLLPDDKLEVTYKNDPRYADTIKREPQAFPWPEYGEITSSTVLSDGTQRMQMSIPMMMCRACPNVAQLILDLDFDQNGAFKAASLEAPQPPKQR